MSFIDFSNYLFRCHSVGNLMVGINNGLTEKQKETLYSLEVKRQEKGLTEKQEKIYGDLLSKKNPVFELSETAKSFLHGIFKEEFFKRNKRLTNKYIEKGLTVEENVISLYTEYNAGLYFEKNKIRFENEFLTGEPDNIQDNKIRDFKSSWDYSTFPLFELKIPNKLYYGQLQGYMDLTGYSKAELIYVLVDTPLTLILDEQRRIAWKSGLIDLPEDLEEEIERNMTYSDIPVKNRIKIFEVEKNEAYINLLHKVIDLSRKYLNSLNDSVSTNVKIKL